jgi:hypothetical protein
VKGQCEYRWDFFTLAYGEGGTHVWVGKTKWRGNTVNVRVDMTGNRVRSIGMYVERRHVCYPFYITCDGVR